MNKKYEETEHIEETPCAAPATSATSPGGVMASPGYARVQSAPRKAGVAPSVAADEANVFSPRNFFQVDSKGGVIGGSATNAVRAHGGAGEGRSVRQVRPLGEGGAPVKGLGTSWGEGGIPDPSCAGAGGKRIQGRIPGRTSAFSTGLMQDRGSVRGAGSFWGGNKAVNRDVEGLRSGSGKRKG